MKRMAQVIDMSQVSSGQTESVSTESRIHSEPQSGQVIGDPVSSRQIESVPAATESKSDSVRPQPDRVIDFLFVSLSAKYGHRWGSQFTSDDKARVIKGEWARGLVGLKAQELRKGLDACIHQYPDWPPTVGQFLVLCKVSRAEAGLPDVVEAWSQISRTDRPFTHGVVLAMRKDAACNWSDWRMLPEDRALKLFDPIYRRYIDRALAGEEFELPAMLPEKSRQRIPLEDRLRCMPTVLDEMTKIRNLLR
jgi:hypothetical protein